MHSITAARGDGVTIGQLSKLTGVNVETIRYYEKIGLLPAPPRRGNGRRAFGPMETRVLAFIRRARQLGFTLDEIRALLALGGPGQASCADVCAIATRHVADIRRKIDDLRKLERTLHAMVDRCSDEAAPNCAVLDVLYPSQAELTAAMNRPSGGWG
jgi:MerR family mercuric resistance operon transcriptional regulator